MLLKQGFYLTWDTLRLRFRSNEPIQLSEMPGIEHSIPYKSFHNYKEEYKYKMYYYFIDPATRSRNLT